MLNKKLLAVVIAGALGLGGCNSNNDDKTSTVAADINLRVMETTDLHTNMMDYNYYSDKKTRLLVLFVLPV